MSCRRVLFPDGASGIVTLGGPTLSIEVDGKVYPFEDHRYCGPMPLDRRGNSREFGPRHRFWHAVTQWCQGGKKTGMNGRAEWSEPVDETLGMVRVGKHFFPPETYERLLKGRT